MGSYIIKNNQPQLEDGIIDCFFFYDFNCDQVVEVKMLLLKIYFPTLKKEDNGW